MLFRSHKSGLRLENISKIWDHVIGKSVLGYKLLACAFYDGVSLLPLDFTLHREKGKNKKSPYGLKKRVLQKQSKKDRSKGSAGEKRDKESNMNKIKAGIQMLKRAVKNGFVPDYVLCDSWFFCLKLLQAVRAFKKGAVHLLSMCKMGKINFEWMGKQYSAGQLLKHLQEKKKRCRKVNSYYIECVVTFYRFDAVIHQSHRDISDTMGHRSNVQRTQAIPELRKMSVARF